MELIKHHTEKGYRVAVVVATGPKWMKLAYVGDKTIKKVRKTEQRYMVILGEARPKDIRRINQAARRNGRSARSKLIP